jgi:tetratricopeptide (TPR) repeat protein
MALDFASKGKKRELYNIHKAIADSYFRNAIYDEAITHYTEALELASKEEHRVLVYNNRAWAWEGREDYDQAIADFTRALDIDSNYAQAYYGRGYCWLEKGESERAILDAKDAVTLDPNNTLYDDFYYELTDPGADLGGACD